MITSCGCKCLPRPLSKDGPTVTAATTFTVFGEPTTLGELATLVGKRPGQLWSKMRHGMSAEEAAFGASNAAAVAAIITPRGTATEAVAKRTTEDRIAALESTVAALKAIVDRILSGTANTVKAIRKEWPEMM